MRRKRSTHHGNVVADTNLHFQHDGNVDDLHAHIDNQLADSTPLFDAGLTAQSAKTTEQDQDNEPESLPDEPCDPCIESCSPCMNGGVFVESEPAAPCSYLSLVPAFQIRQGAALGTVPVIANFELSFTLLLNQAIEEADEPHAVMTIQNPNNLPGIGNHCEVTMYKVLRFNTNNGGVYQ